MSGAEPEEVRERLVDLASDRPRVQETAESWFRNRGAEALSDLVEGLRDTGLGSVGHMRILRLLAELGDPAALPAIRDALRKGLARPDPIVVPAAMDALAATGAPEAADELERLLEHDDPDVVKHAALLLGDRRWGVRAPALARLLERPEQGVRYAAVQALLEMKGREVETILTGHLERETDPEVRARIREGGVGSGEGD